MPIVYICIGSNVGNRIVFLKKAISEIKNLNGIVLRNLSSVYETEPWGYKEQGYFLNQVIEIETKKKPAALLKKLKETEKKLGRSEGKKWQEREIDIDILFYGDYIIKKRGLEIPHPEIQNRKFVLIPLNEIAPAYIHPVLGNSMSEILRTLRDNNSVVKQE